MFSFLKKKEAKPRYNVYIHMRDKERCGVAPPPVRIQQSQPDWWTSSEWEVDETKFSHRFGNVYDPTFWAAFSAKDRKEVLFPTAKGCPAFSDYMSSGYVFKLWTDLLVNAGEDGTMKITAADNHYNSDSKIGVFERDSVFPTIRDKIFSKNIVKFDSDWTMTTDPGVSLFFEGVPGEGLTCDWYTFPGIVPADKYPLDIKWIFDWKGEPGCHIIHAGTPLIRVIPFVRSEFHLEPGSDDFAHGGDRQKCPYFVIRKALNKNWPYESPRYKGGSTGSSDKINTQNPSAEYLEALDQAGLSNNNEAD
jgi:hypothetical protein